MLIFRRGIMDDMDLFLHHASLTGMHKLAYNPYMFSRN